MRVARSQLILSGGGEGGGGRRRKLSRKGGREGGAAAAAERKSSAALSLADRDCCRSSKRGESEGEHANATRPYIHKQKFTSPPMSVRVTQLLGKQKAAGLRLRRPGMLAG